MESQASNASEPDLAPLRDRVLKAQQFAQWTASAHEHREQFAPQVVVAVMRDYLGKWESLLPELRSEALHVSEERRRQSERALLLEAASRQVDAQVDELRLRNVIGELSFPDFEAREQEARATIDPEALPSCRSVMARIDELLAQVGAVQSRMAEAGRWLAALAPADVPPPAEADPEPSIVVAAPEQRQAPVAPLPLGVPVAPSTTAPSLSAVAPSPLSLVPPGLPAPAVSDELGEDAYREGGGGGEDEWDVPQAAPPPILRAAVPEPTTPPGSWSPASISSTMNSEDMLATGMVAPRVEPPLELQDEPEAPVAPPVLSNIPPAGAIPVPGEGPRLLVFPPEGKEVLYPFNGDVMSMGRGRNNDIQIKNDGKISRYHCRIFRRGDEFIIEDNKSSNGTLVDGKLITRQPLQGGEHVQIGETRMVFQL